jgi:hypothetical protein
MLAIHSNDNEVKSIPRTINRMNHPGSAIFRNVRRCILSLKLSSRRVSIQPLSLFIRLMECRCRSMPATIPGTPATDSRNTFRIMY